MLSPYRIRPNAEPSLEIILRPSVEYLLRVAAAFVTVVLGLLAPVIVLRSPGGWPVIAAAVAVLVFVAPALRVLLTFPRDRHGSRVSIGGGAIVLRTEGRIDRVLISKLRLVFDRRHGKLLFDLAGRVTLTLATHRRQDLRVLQDRLHQITGRAVADASTGGDDARRGPVASVEVRLQRPSFVWAFPLVLGAIAAVVVAVRGAALAGAVVFVIAAAAAWVTHRRLGRRLPRALRVSPLGLSVTERDGTITLTPRVHLRPTLTAGLLRFPAAGCAVHSYQLAFPEQWPAFLEALGDCVGHDVRV